MSQKKIIIYTPTAKVELVKDKTAPRSKLKGVIDFVHYLRYRDSVTGEYILKSKKYKELIGHFFSQYQIVEAAGGVVFNDKGELLLIFRRGFWDLPKGKFERGESKKDCALREVEEETGVKKLKIIAPLSLYFNQKKTTYHTYRYKRRPTIKPSHWYIMTAHDQKLIPQTEEDIEIAQWVKPAHFEQYYSQMYPAIIDVLKSVKDLGIKHK